MRMTALLLFPLMATLLAAVPDLAELQKMTARFAPVEMRVDLSALPPGDRKALPTIIQAARIYNDIFLTQRWSGNHELYNKLKRETTPISKARLHYFWLNKGPWS